MAISAPYLKRAASGVWYIHWTEDRIGKRVSTREKDLDGPRGAKAFFANWMMLTNAAPVGGADLTFRDIWTVYEDKHVRANVTNQWKAEHTGRLLLQGFGHLLLPQIDQNRIDAYVLARTTGKIGAQRVKPQTVRHELSYLVAALNFCSVRPHKLIELAQAEEITKNIKLPAAGEARDRWLRADEMQRLLVAAGRRRGEDNRLTRCERFLWLALETAARKQAILDLTWDRVDFETNVIRYDVPGRKITKKRRATVPISDTLRPVLLRAFSERQSEQVVDSRAPIWAAVQSVVADAGLAPAGYERPKTGEKPKATGVSPHVLRHTAATHMARRRVPLYVVAAVLGNTLEMITKVYGHHCKDDLQDAVNLISNGLLEAAE